MAKRTTSTSLQVEQVADNYLRHSTVLLDAEYHPHPNMTMTSYIGLGAEYTPDDIKITSQLLLMVEYIELPFSNVFGPRIQMMS